MRLQILFIVLFAVICGLQCASDDGWDFKKNYGMSEDGDYYNNDVPYDDDDNDNYKNSYDRKSRKKYDDDDSYEKKPSYKDNKKYDDDDSYEKKPSYKDNKKYDDDDSYEKKPSYKDNKKYDNSDEDYDKDDKYSGRRPSKKSTKKPKDVGHMNVYLREPSKDGKRKKPKRFRFPVANYERDNFPNTFGPLISFMPWLPIFADRLTKQTIIYSPTGGVYILPPVINFYGKLISVAQLISSGYASLVSTGAPPPPAVDVAPLVQSGPVVGPGVPTVDPSTGGFKGGVRTEYRSFPRANYAKDYDSKPAYPQKDGYSKPTGGY